MATGWTRRYSFGFIFVLLLAFALRIWDVSVRSLWFDEAVEYSTANAPLWQLPANVLGSLQPPLYTFLLHMWLQLGIQPLYLRLLSIIFSMLTVVGVMILARRWWGLRGSIIAGMIIAVLPSGIRYAQEIGEYALMVCALTWALVFLEDAVRTGRWRSWGLWALFSLASLYSQYGTPIVLAPLAAGTLLQAVWCRRKKAVGQQIGASILILVISLPLLLYFLPQQISKPTSGAFRVPVQSLSGEAGKFGTSLQDTLLFQLTNGLTTPRLALLEQALVIILAVLILVILLFSPAKRQKRILLWFTIVYIAYFLTVRTGLYAYGNSGGRYSLIVLPLFAWAVTAVVEQLIRWRGAYVAFGLLAALAGISLYSLPNQSLLRLMGQEPDWHGGPEDMSSITQYWLAYRTKDQPTYVYYGAVPAFRYYLELNHVETDAVFFGEWFRGRPLEQKLVSLESALGGYPQDFWLIFSHIVLEEDSALLQELGKRYTVVRTYTHEGAAVYLLERR